MLFPEGKPEFKKPLTDQSVKEDEKITLECELTKPNMKVKWLKNGKEIKPDNKRITVSMDQYLHQLVIADVTVEEAAKYTCKCGDVSTECTIKVEGKISWQLKSLILYNTFCNSVFNLSRWFIPVILKCPLMVMWYCVNQSKHSSTLWS